MNIATEDDPELCSHCGATLSRETYSDLCPDCYDDVHDDYPYDDTDLDREYDEWRESWDDDENNGDLEDYEYDSWSY